MTPWVTRLIFANAGMFLLTGVMPRLVLPLGLVPAEILVRPWTPVTYMFLHADLMHLLFNMLILFFFGPRLEARLGGRRFLILYFVSGFLGALLSVVTPYSLIIGASGATYGVFGAFAVLWPRERVLLWFIVPIEIRVLAVALVSLAIWLAATGGGAGIAHFAHLGGFLGGWASLKAFDLLSPARRFRQKAAPPPGPSGERDVLRWQRIDRTELHPVNREELDRVLEKIGAHGLKSLTTAERAFLERFSTE